MDSVLDNTKAVFNGGLFTIERIHTLKSAYHSFMIQDSWENAADCLIEWRCEVDYGKLTAEDTKTCDDWESKLITLTRSGDKNNPNIHMILRKYFIVLNKISHRIGLGVPDEESGEFAAEEV